MTVALLETIESKDTLIETMSRETKTRGSRLRCLLRHSSGDLEEVEEDRLQQRQQRPDQLTTPPEIEFEQPRHSAENEDSLISIANVKFERNRKC